MSRLSLSFWRQICATVLLKGGKAPYYRLAGDGIAEELAAADSYGASHKQRHRPFVEELKEGR